MAESIYQWLKANPGRARVELSPHAMSIGPTWRQPSTYRWLTDISGNGDVRLTNSVTGHFIGLPETLLLTKNFTSAPPPDGLVYLTLAVNQTLELCGGRANWQPIRRRRRRLFSRRR